MGEWTGANRLWMSPDDPPRESATTVSIAPAAGKGFVAMRYTWSFDGTDHDGLLIARNGAEPGGNDIAWVDSFHTGGQIMTFAGRADADGHVSTLGSYPAPPGPDWGWSIVLQAGEGGGEGGDAERAEALRIVMHNIPPGEDPQLAVEIECTRSDAG